MRILSLTSTRSDYDLMSALYRNIKIDSYFDFKLVVAGTHISGHHDSTIKYIVKDGFENLYRIESLSNIDSPLGQVQSFGKLLIEISPVVNDFCPDLGFVVGDREDALAFAVALTYLGIPFVHFYGGDHSSDGHIDNRARHAISKLATFHFVSAVQHKERLLALGEEPERIKVVGNLSLDNFINEPYISKNAVLEDLSIGAINAKQRLVLFLYHPMPSDMVSFEENFPFLIKILRELDYKVIIAKPNHDPGYSKVIDILESVSSSDHVFYIGSPSRDVFINLLRNIDLLIGNSSLAILEAPTLRLPAINIGNRQVGRLSAGNVVFSEFAKHSLVEALKEVNSSEFREKIRLNSNPYGDGKSSPKVLRILKDLKLVGLQNKKLDPLGAHEYSEKNPS
jgi:GDP/UDP-N,N'-diacetylbacillosamine 2-epimerase (hydrolysing)